MKRTHAETQQPTQAVWAQHTSEEVNVGKSRSGKKYVTGPEVRKPVRFEVPTGQGPGDEAERSLRPTWKITKKPTTSMMEDDDEESEDEGVPRFGTKEKSRERERGKEQGYATKAAPPAPRPGPSFQRLAPINNINIEQLSDQFLDLPISLSIRDVLGSSDKLAAEIKRMLTKQRVSTRPTAAVLLDSTGKEGEVVDSVGLDAVVEQYPFTMDVLQQSLGHMPQGSIVLSDAVNDLHRSNPEYHLPQVKSQPFLADEAAPLMTLHADVNGSGLIECILDSGSQIISMSESAARKQNVSWDPDIKINLQSANNQLNKSKGLAKNVPIRVGEITFYAQVHIIETAAYDVLLGRPFDLVTTSKVDNRTDGTQLLTLTDPHTKRRCSIIAQRRGYVQIAKKQQNPVFQ